MTWTSWRKDGKRFSDSGGWGYAVFEFDAATDTFRPGNSTDTPPQAHDAKCGYACHTIVAAKDYVFTASRSGESEADLGRDVAQVAPRNVEAVTLRVEHD
jgi:hypothetical protein